VIQIESIPNAKRTFDALRSLGYDLNSSIADVIDNAITPKVNARKVEVEFRRRSNRFICRIKDNGCGMNDSTLQEAMRLGAETSYQKNDLGKFGMGMKTASLSHCNTLTVISWAGGDFTGFKWDMDHVKNSKEWSLLKLEKHDIDKVLENEEEITDESGTIIMWDDLFLLDKDYESYSSDKQAENYYYRILEDLKLHLRMVFHRFLDGSLGKGKTVVIAVNGKELTAWDPFCRHELNTTETMLYGFEKFELPEKLGFPILIRAYVLPNKEGFSSEEAWKDAKGPSSWNDSQGYYIYRENRLIRFGGWQGTKAKDEHDKLARISIDIDAELDSFFRITVNKSRVQFPEALYYHLKTRVNPIAVKKAKAQYKQSDSKHKISNKFRKQDKKLGKVSKQLTASGQIRTDNANGNVSVQNPNGSYISNRVNEFLKYGSGGDFEVISEELESSQLWRIVCNENEKFKVIVNASHPFYKKVYESGANKNVTATVDALIFSLAFAELFNRNEQNSNLFDTFKNVCSKTLERLTQEDLV
jgi:hypothetical protein